jgi:CheY-like chemotaxis protein
MELDMAKFDLATTIYDVVDQFLEPTQRKGVTLECQIDPELLGCWRGDAGRFRQILTNLMGNAVKFTERGNVVIHLQRHENGEAKADVILKVSVCDTGIGIPLEAQQRIFNPFAQADGSMSRRFGGTGLGLAIVQRLVEMMGGEVGLISTPGKGSTFWFTVCLQKQGALETARGTNEQADRQVKPRVVLLGRADAHSPMGPSRTRVLLAEDDPTNRDVFRRMLELCGESVDTVKTGREAILALEQSPYDLIFMDCEMPEMDGLTATAEIRRRGVARADGTPIPIIALTGYAVSGHQTACMASGMDGFLAKPVRLEEIQKAVRQWLPDRESRAA